MIRFPGGKSSGKFYSGKSDGKSDGKSGEPTWEESAKPSYKQSRDLYETRPGGNQNWDDYKMDFGKTHLYDGSEDTFRSGVYADNMKFIEHHCADLAFTCGVNTYSDHTHDEFMQRLLSEPWHKIGTVFEGRDEHGPHVDMVNWELMDGIVPLARGPSSSAIPGSSAILQAVKAMLAIAVLTMAGVYVSRIREKNKSGTQMVPF